ncbi:nitric oxide reductase NorE protein [Aquimarina sp. MAR_2010_214]|uniref:cytochrome c oxidase subunit 3 n=1 Tax=Aquimarina sp. MAR_2010_214 TaxID=1250026 RepID=UPI000C70E77F|nr:cytochrome c oxidase subunit 3 [Aquimarina sp. MAR_2010_214]PKV51038.1 nitric oxide reductase NorE protein [Aquimarina sp. MAR_2010_214]
MKISEIDHKNIFYPPGGILLWIIIYLELLTFGIALIVMVFYGKQEPDIFHTSRLLLNPTFGMMNTIFLLTSGFLMAISVRELKTQNTQKAKQYLLLTMFFGMLFLLLKTIEYYDKIEAGLGMGYNTFFSFYWMLTLFHVVHVIVGLVILITIYYGILKEKKSTTIEDVEASAAFWHMCDLIWLLLFPIMYLLF